MLKESSELCSKKFSNAAIKQAQTWTGFLQKIHSWLLTHEKLSAPFVSREMQVKTTRIYRHSSRMAQVLLTVSSVDTNVEPLELIRGAASLEKRIVFLWSWADTYQQLPKGMKAYPRKRLVQEFTVAFFFFFGRSQTGINTDVHLQVGG